MQLKNVDDDVLERFTPNCFSLTNNWRVFSTQQATNKCTFILHYSS